MSNGMDAVSGNGTKGGGGVEVPKAQFVKMKRGNNIVSEFEG